MSIYLINNIIVPLEEEADFRREALRALRCKGSDLLKVGLCYSEKRRCPQKREYQAETIP